MRGYQINKALLAQLRLKFYNYFLNQKLKTLSIDRKPICFEDARTVAILFDASSPENQVTVSNYKKRLRGMGKKVEVMAFVNNKDQQNTNYVFKHFNKKNLNWYFHPTGSTISQFINEPYDILMCLHTNPVLPLEYISALSKAHLRVGPYYEDKTFCYDLMIDNMDDDDLNNFIGQIDNVLKIINRKDDF